MSNNTLRDELVEKLCTLDEQRRMLLCLAILRCMVHAAKEGKYRDNRKRKNKSELKYLNLLAEAVSELIENSEADNRVEVFTEKFDSMTFEYSVIPLAAHSIYYYIDVTRERNHSLMYSIALSSYVWAILHNAASFIQVCGVAGAEGLLVQECNEILNLDSIVENALLVD